jgi:hypothetical protein
MKSSEIYGSTKDRFGVAALEKANDALRVAKLAGHQSSVALWTEVAAILWRDQGWS